MKQIVAVSAALLGAWIFSWSLWLWEAQSDGLGDAPRISASTKQESEPVAPAPAEPVLPPSPPVTTPATDLARSPPPPAPRPELATPAPRAREIPSAMPRTSDPPVVVMTPPAAESETQQKSPVSPTASAPQMVIDPFSDNPVQWVSPAAPRTESDDGRKAHESKLREELAVDSAGFATKHGLSSQAVDGIRTDAPK